MGKLDLVVIGASAGRLEGLSAIVRELKPSIKAAVRILEEHGDMKLRMADRAGDAGLNEVRKGFVAGAQDSHRHAEAIRQLLFSRREIEPGDALRATAPVVRVRAAKAKPSGRSRSRRS
jgi:hypothetical protein